jgi:hypothetical protein
MRQIVRAQVMAVSCAAIVAGLGGSAGAQANPPAKAKTARLALVTAYRDCYAPNATHGAAVACNPPERYDPVCGFGPGGRGSITIHRRNGAATNMAVDLDLQGLDAGCEGRELCLELLVRTTHAQDATCTPGGGGCTLQDTPTVACCRPANGACRIRNAELHRSHAPVVEAEILGCAVRRIGYPLPPVINTFACGFFADTSD